MRIFGRFVLFSCAVLFTACATHNGYRVNNPATFFVQERDLVIHELPCQWLHGKSSPHQRQQYDFGCHGGMWGSVSLFLDVFPQEPEQVQRIRLLWREWNPGYRPDSEKNTAALFLKHVVERFTPAVAAHEVWDAFWQRQAVAGKTGNHHIRYDWRMTPTHRLHRLEINILKPGEGEVQIQMPPQPTSKPRIQKKPKIKAAPSAKPAPNVEPQPKPLPQPAFEPIIIQQPQPLPQQPVKPAVIKKPAPVVTPPEIKQPPEPELQKPATKPAPKRPTVKTPPVKQPEVIKPRMKRPDKKEGFMRNEMPRLVDPVVNEESITQPFTDDVLLPGTNPAANKERMQEEKPAANEVIEFEKIEKPLKLGPLTKGGSL